MPRAWRSALADCEWQAVVGLKSEARRRLYRLGWELERHPRAESRVGLLRHILTDQRVDAVLDVGANEGQFGGLLRTIGYRGALVSFEPVDAAFTVLADRARRSPPWSVHRVALGREAAVQSLHVGADTQVSSFLAPTSDYYELLSEAATPTTELPVAVEPLDGLAPSEPLLSGAERLFLKVDTQGYDLEVLDGAAATLERVVALQIELAVRHIYAGAPDWREALGAVEARGFVLSGLFPLATDRCLRLVEMDAVLVRAEA